MMFRWVEPPVPSTVLAEPSGATPPDGLDPLIILIAAGILVFAIMSMWRAVGPVLEIVKAALYAVSTFALIALAMVLLLISFLW